MKKTFERKSFELLLPVGQKEMAMAAIHFGADAIFLGMPGFNARGRSHDFSIEELQEIIETCHLYGVKVNLAFNILIFENELEQARNVLQKVLPLKPDAFIVQDLGLVRLIRKMAPGQVIHASTQMTVTNDLAIRLLEDLRIKRFVLGRENSLSEIKLIKERCAEELEVFVHGALCVSYSGQCFTSESLGGRSANRGQCAQSCRFSYELVVDGQKKNLIDRDYLVSPQDLCGLAEIPELMKIGVSSFKVEGRLKTPEYVARIAGAYRKAIDKVLQESELSPTEIAAEKNRMATEYSRGFFSGWLHGVNHQKLVDGSFNSHRGAYLGEIAEVRKNSFLLKLQNQIVIEAGDGILWATSGKTSEVGSFVYKASPLGDGSIWLEVENGLIEAGQDELLGAKVYLNHSRSFKKEFQKSLGDRQKQRRVPVSMQAHLELGESLKVTLSDGRFSVSAQTPSVAVVAISKALSFETLSEELGALGGTVFKLSELVMNDIGDKKLFINHREIKQLRQGLIQRLELIRRSNNIDGFNSQFSEASVVENNCQAGATSDEVSPNTIQSNEESCRRLTLLLRDIKQVMSLCEAFRREILPVENIESIILDFEFGRDYKESLDAIRALGIKTGIATTRILKPQEYQNLKNIFNLKPDIILIRNLGSLSYFSQLENCTAELRGDFSLNVANSKTADYLLRKGLRTLCISYDLNFDQVSDLLKSAKKQGFSLSLEITVHQSMPSFHMEHCVFAAFLSQGTSFRDCGKPCEKHRVQLKDQFGNWHWIKPDQECRNTMFNSRAQTALSYLNDWKKLGLGLARYEALNEQGPELVEKIRTYLQFLDAKIGLHQALEQIGSMENYGLSSGNLAKGHEYQSRKKDLNISQIEQ